MTSRFWRAALAGVLLWGACGGEPETPIALDPPEVAEGTGQCNPCLNLGTTSTLGDGLTPYSAFPLWCPNGQALTGHLYNGANGRLSVRSRSLGNHKRLFFTDNPETVYTYPRQAPSAGDVPSYSLYSNSVGAGVVDVYTYHGNGDAKPRLFDVILSNPSAQAVNVGVQFVDNERVSGDPVSQGANIVYNYLSSSFHTLKTFSVPGNGAVSLFAQLPSSFPGGPVPVAPNPALTFQALVELNLSGTLQITEVSTGSSNHNTPLKAFKARQAAHLPMLKACPKVKCSDVSTHDRGVFPSTQWNIVLNPYDTKQGAKILRVDDEKAGYPAGQDGDPLDPICNNLCSYQWISNPVDHGLYQVMEHISVSVTSSNGQSLAVFLAPGGGTLETAAQLSFPGQSGVHRLAKIKACTDSAPSDQGVYLGTIAPSTTSQVLEINTALNGGGSGPFYLVFVPIGRVCNSSPKPHDGADAGEAGGVCRYCIQDGNASLTGDGSDCCSMAYDPVTLICGPQCGTSGQSCDPMGDAGCCDPAASCQLNHQRAQVCCIADGQPETLSDGSDCCSLQNDGAGNCGPPAACAASGSDCSQGQRCCLANDVCAPLGNTEVCCVAKGGGPDNGDYNSCCDGPYVDHQGNCL